MNSRVSAFPVPGAGVEELQAESVTRPRLFLVKSPGQPATVTLADVKTSCTSSHGLTVNTTVLKSGGYTVVGRSAANWLNTVNSMVGMGASLAAGKTAQDHANFLAGLP